MNEAELRDIRSSLEGKERSELEDLALRAALFHARSCDAAARPSPLHEDEPEHGHRPEPEIRQRLQAQSREALLDLLAPLAALVRGLR